MTEETKVTLALNSQTDASPDAKGKEVWGLKLIAARLLQFLIPSFEHCSIEDIVKKHLSNANESNTLIDDISPFIDMENAEFSSLNEKLIRFDNLFEATDPVSGKKIQIDIEPQSTYRPTEKCGDKYKVYDLEKRAIYYCARLISRQLQQKSSHDYNSLKKVYSIWIITDGYEKGLENTTDNYKVARIRTDDDGNETISMEYDPCEVKMLFLGENPPKDSVFEFIRAVYDYNEPLLDKYLNWNHNDAKNITRKEMKTMLAYHQRQIDEAAEKARAEAKEEASRELTISHINSMRRKGCSDEQIANLLDLELSVVEKTPKENE